MRAHSDTDMRTHAHTQVDFLDTYGDLKAKIVEHLIEQGVDGADKLGVTGVDWSMDKNLIDAGDEDTVAQLLGISKLDELFSSGTRAITVRSKAPKTERKRVGGRDQPKAPSKTRDRNDEENSNSPTQN